MKMKSIRLLILFLTIIGTLLLSTCKANPRAIKNKHIIRYFIEFPFSLSIAPTVSSLNSKEAKERGSFIYDYQILPVINPKDSIVGIDLQEAFLEYKQVYNWRKDTLINEECCILVLAISKRGRKMANDWNQMHYYFEMKNRYWMRSRVFRTKCLFYNTRFAPLDSIHADTIVLDIRDLFRRRRPDPKDVAEIWVNHTFPGKIMLIKNKQEKSDSAETKWNAPLYYPYVPSSFDYTKPKIFKIDTNGVLGRPVPQETISSQYFVTEKLGKKHRRHRLVHRYKTPYDINYKLDITKMDFAEVYLEKGENYNLVFVYSDEGKKMAKEWNQEHGYHKLSWEKNGRYTLPLSSDTPLDTLLADTLVVNLKHLFKENPRYPQPDHVRKIWDELYQFGTITLVKE